MKFYGGKDKLYLEYFIYGLPIQKILISDLNGKTKFYFTNLTDRIFGVSNIITLLFEIKLLQRGYTLVHSGGVIKDGGGILLSAWSEMGKSSTIFALSKEGFNVLGDDKVILSKNGNLYAYPEKAGIFFHSKNVESLDLKLSEKINLGLKYLISKIPPLYLYIDPNLRIDLSKIVKVGKKVKLQKSYFLEWGKGEEKISKKLAKQKIITSTLQCLFANYFAREVFFAYCYLNDFDPNFIEKKMSKILNKSLKECRIIRSRKKGFYKYLKF